MNFANSFPLRKCTQTLINRKRTEEPNVFTVSLTTVFQCILQSLHENGIFGYTQVHL
jgi:hypothetical protein